MLPSAQKWGNKVILGADHDDTKGKILYDMTSLSYQNPINVSELGDHHSSSAPCHRRCYAKTHSQHI
ncbi:hypothetical protein Y032_0082g1536 [Ancylostoma ceylanicum]|uniref:Uncharacterized protein n=1 Tax=Ancylostoma ceylanicum TaxID=53326 RepID=A0A016TQN1_9BILA|nr:hypothetical protein Y032_0082g1536 [Ancylostoma ceylanicum]